MNCMLQLNVSQMLKGPIGEARIIAVDDNIALEGRPASPVKGEARLMRTNRSILVHAEATTEVALECARCLTSYDCPVLVQFDEEYFPTTDVSSGILLPDPEETEAFTIDERLTLDLTEALRQYILTAIPMKPLCREECPGLTV